MDMVMSYQLMIQACMLQHMVLMDCTVINSELIKMEFFVGSGKALLSYVETGLVQQVTDKEQKVVIKLA